MTRHIDLELAESDLRRRLFGGLDAREQFLDPQHELARTERLRDVIVGAELEPEHAIHFRRARGEHQNRNRSGRRIAAENLADLEPVDFRQHQIEDDQRRPFIARRGRARVRPWRRAARTRPPSV